jgi:hypothetical protein
MMDIPNGPVKASEMSRDKWILYKWENITTLSDKEPVYLCTGIRPIEEAVEAANNFDTWRQYYQ